ncbi:unnamed protein product [Dibothriocephalus latus]|uniref:Uncharacterized protein n=1 Tax=Dibothriocephalus latus TaxID=60516 RepID=A0A3P7N5I9_DIBLA|nr:unnamed protein product [Dibothriocephalus latus]
MPATEEMNFGFQRADIHKRTTDHEVRAPERQSADYGLKKSGITAVPLQIPLEGASHMGRMDGQNIGYDMKDTKGMNSGFQKTDILKRTTDDELRAPEGPFADYFFKGSSIIAAPLQIPLEGAPHVGSSVVGKEDYEMLATEKMNFVFRKTDAPKRTTDDALRVSERPSIAYIVDESNLITAPSVYPLAAETYYDMDIRNNARKAGGFQKCPQAYAGVFGASHLIPPKNYRGPDNTEVSNSMLVSGRRHVVDMRRESGGYSYDFGYDSKPLSSDLRGCPPKLKKKTTDSENLKNNWNFRRTHALGRHTQAEKSGFIDMENF